jgi:hypothetical protein
LVVLTEDAPAPSPPPDGGARDFPDSLCHGCAGRRTIEGRASTFIMCVTLEVKYPRQPVRACLGFRARDDG